MPPSGQADEQRPLAHLRIEEPRASDEALYKCDVTYVKGKCPSISLVRLQVLALPSKAQLFQLSAEPAPQRHLLADGQLLGPVNEHEQLRLVCLVEGGRPEPRSVIWRKLEPGGRTVNLLAARASPLQSGLELELNHTLTSADLGAKFECHVEHEALEQRAALELSQAAEQTGASGGQKPADAMLDLHPSVELAGGAGEASGAAAASRSARPLDSHVFVDLNVGIASLDLFMAKVNKKEKNAREDQLREGDLVELECVAYNSKPPANISWSNGLEPIEQLDAASQSSGKRGARHKRLLQRNQVQLNADGQTYTTHSFLSIKLSRHEHKAQIVCQAQSPSMRQPLAKSLELQVQYAPVVLMEPAAGLLVNEWEPHASELAGRQQEAVSIYCIYTANPSELLANSSRWFKDGEQLSLAEAGGHLSESRTNTGYPVLHLQRPTRKHAGFYDCQLSNALGPSQRLLPAEGCRLQVNFKPSVRLRLLRAPAAPAANLSELAELDAGQELVVAANAYLLHCQVLEAQPSKIEKFHWFKSRSSVYQQQLVGVTDGPQFLLGPLPANFTPSAFACAAFNSLGSSQLSNPVELQLSHAPGPSFARLADEESTRKILHAEMVPTRHASQLSSVIEARMDATRFPPASSAQPFAAGSQLLLECVTPNPGQPRANTWLWFKNGQAIENSASLDQQHFASNENHNNNNNNNIIINPSSSSRNSALSGVNPITGQKDNNRDLSSAHQGGSEEDEDDQRAYNNNRAKRNQPLSQEQLSKIKFINAGRYLHISSIQLNHKGSYSCVAVNRFGSGPQPQQSTNEALERDSFQLSVAVGPSFVQPLASRTFWPEVEAPQLNSDAINSSESAVSETIAENRLQLELVCHVQCEPLCQIEWFRNNEPLDVKKLTESALANYVNYKVKQTVMDEESEVNLFKSIESRLLIQFNKLHANGESREKILERRFLLNGSNYTCQSTANSMGPPVRSTTKFVVQYPPEHVLINAPSDKLSLVEGSNGPRLRCEASSEPQVQYRWFLLKSGSSDLAMANVLQFAKTNSLAAASKLSQSHQTSSSSSPSYLGTDGGSTEQQRAINQLPNRARMDKLSLPAGRGANDRAGQSENLIELTESSSTTSTPLLESDEFGPQTRQEGGQPASVSTLDLSNLSLNRGQTGHYICEASNKLGQARQSVYVNILYKPTCATLHLYSLDLKVPSADSLLSNNNLKQSDGTGYFASNDHPMKNSAQYEYSIVRETSEDFIDLRKILVLAPLLNRHHRLQASDIKGTTAKNNNYNNDELASSESLSFRGSIFETILNDKQQEDKVSLQPKDKDALLENSEGKGDIQQKNNLLLPIDNNTQQQNQLKQEKNNKSLDSWDKFNILLLKFLNNYIKQVRNYEKQTLESESSNYIINRQANLMKTNKDHRSQTTRRSSQDFHDKQTASSNRIDQPIMTEGVKNLLTFACLAQSGNPMSNLTFNWSFGATNLPETGGDAAQPIFDGDYSFQAKPTWLYSNENHTLHVILVRRLDTGSSLNPFQMSLVTLNVIVERQASDVVGEIVRRSDSMPSVTNWTRPLTVARSRYHSFYNSPRANQLPQASNNIRFTQEFETKPNNIDDPAVVSIDLNERGWQEQIGTLLKCSVTNPIGTSEVCYAQVNVAERLRSSSSSSSEYAKWRMPSLAQKSFLIISILVGCALIVFVASALLLGPHLRNFNLKHVDELSSAASSGKDGTTNTGQSSSSQKSSELGLLGNGESSLQGSSSDEENSARLNHQHHLHHHNNQHQHDRSEEIMTQGNDRLPTSELKLQSVTSSNHLLNDYTNRNQYNDCSSGYDRPRSMQTDKLSGGKLLQGNTGGLSGYCYRDEAYPDDQTPNAASRTEQLDSNATQQNSAGSRLLANLKFKSLSSRFKVDKISDLTDFASRLDNLRNLHTKNVSNSETTTTGTSALDSTELSLKMDSPNSSGSSTVFGALNLRHSLSSGYNHKAPQQNIPPRSSNVGRAQAPYYLYNQSIPQAEVSLNANQMLLDPHSHRNMPMASSPAYSNVASRNMSNTSSFNVMDEFIRQREVPDQPSFTTNLEYQSKSAAFYRSQSVRNSLANMNPHQASVYLFEHDLNHQQQLYNNTHRLPLNYGPPVYPRTLQHQQQMGIASGTQYLQNIDTRPTVASRLSHIPVHNMELPSVQHYRQESSARNNRFSMPSYNHTLGLGTTTASTNSTLVPVSSTTNYLETIDSHLDRLGETLASGHHLASQPANNSLSHTTSLDASNVANNDQSRQQQDLYNDISQSSSGNQSTEHIYDTNAYATPEKSPVKRLSKMFGQPHQAPPSAKDERPRVSQLIQTFNSKVPE